MARTITRERPRALGLGRQPRLPGAAPLIWGVAALLVLVLAVYPLLRVVIEAFVRADAPSLTNFGEIVGRSSNLLAIRHSLEVSLASTVFSTLLGTCLAWLVARTDLPGARLFRTAFVLPFLIPPFVGALAWVHILGPVGYLNQAWKALTGSPEPLFVIYGPVGIVLVLVLHGFPLVYLTVLGGLERMNPELEEAAEVGGSGRWQVLRDVTLPLMTPTILAGAVLTFTTDVANFGIPAVLGYSEGYFVLPTKIYEQIAKGFGSPNSLNVASAMSVILAVFGAIALLLQAWLLRGDRAQRFQVISGKSMQPNVVRLGAWRPWLVALSVLLVLATSVGPLLAVGLTSLVRSVGLPPVPQNWTVDHYSAVLTTMPAAGRGIRNSLLLAATSATAIALLGALIAYVVARTRLPGRHLLDLGASLPYVIPGSVVALGMILAWLRPIPAADFTLYNTIWILLLAYVGRYLVFGVRSTAASLAQVHGTLEEAALASGATWVQAFRDVILPLILPGLFAGWFLVFIPALRELTVSILLWSAGNETIGVLVYNLQDSGQRGPSAALATVMIAVLVAANFVARWATKGRVGY